MPAVVVGDHRDARVTDLGLPGELGLGHVRHADHVAAPGPVEVGLGAARKLGAFHRQVGATRNHGDVAVRAGRRHGPAQPHTHRIRHRDVSDAAPGEEGLRAGEGAVHELVDEHEAAGREVFSQRAAGGDRDQVGDTGAFQGVDVGAVVDLTRWNPVSSAVAGQEDILHTTEVAAKQLVRGGSKRRVHRLPARVFQPVELVDAASSDDAHDGASHTPSSPALAPFVHPHELPQPSEREC